MSIKMTEKTPILTGLRKLIQKNIYSFHALPVSSYGKSDIVNDIHEANFGGFEGSATGDLFDNFFFSKGLISESQKMTARLYNSDASFYITGGTSTANQIAISALYVKGQHILIDRNCHQSVHFHTQSIGAEVEYLYPDLQTAEGEISAWSYEHLENTLLSMQQNGKGCDVVILTAQSYEGIIYDIPQVLGRLLAAGVQTRKFFIDEAWGSLNYFSDDTRPLTALNVGSLLNDYPDLEIICTHSAHKSLFCSRQASIIHCRGKKELPDKIETARYRIHTTSPSYPILASLDAAQATMSMHGKALAAHSRVLVNKFISGVSGIKGLGEKAIYREIFKSYWHIHYDPTKVMINVVGLGKATEIKNLLCEENIYIKRFINDSLILNFHIGINNEAVTHLLSSLTDISEKLVIDSESEHEISDKFIIPYPPGVPLVFPGEPIDRKIKSKIQEYIKNGFLIIAA
ncbi:lysine decarboxylase [Cedecea colo]|uniref:Lysine decarboxylase n=1 Tax=Cedecea colo TaxID=2552946 RepID=A0ABX0VNQ1_9ENTR|nr:lysine decarboxylase [Cedecea colo]NIY48299.1 lysine decarboxylase [Cedecea colo]